MASGIPQKKKCEHQIAARRLELKKHLVGSGQSARRSTDDLKVAEEEAEPEAEGDFGGEQVRDADHLGAELEQHVVEGSEGAPQRRAARSSC